MFGAEIDWRNMPTPDACAGLYGAAIEEMSISTGSFGMPDQVDKDLRPAEKLPAPVPPARQISRCSESRIKLQRKSQAQSASPHKHKNPCASREAKWQTSASF
jgi:hypothetical protein